MQRLSLMSLRLMEHLQGHAIAWPDAVAIEQVWPRSGASLTWNELLSDVNHLSEHLAQTVRPGAVVLLSSANRPQYVSAYLAILHAGMTVFPVAPDLTETELLDAARRSSAAAAITICGRGFLIGPHFQQQTKWERFGPDATIFIRPTWDTHHSDVVSMLLLSSGTTATPKIVQRDAVALDAVAEQMVEAVGFTSEDRVLAAVPLCHSYGVEHGLLAPIWAGSCVHLCDGFELHVAMEELSSAGITIFPAVPFMYEMLAESRGNPIALKSLRRAYSAGAALPRALFDALQIRFGVRVTQLYGATEIGSVTFNSAEDQPFDPASVGRPMRNVDIAVLDPDQPDLVRPLPDGTEGHVAISAASMMSGYVENSASATTAVMLGSSQAPDSLDGSARCFAVPQHDSSNGALRSGSFFLTGDLGRIDYGKLTITGRIKLLIDVGGRKVNPLEVERVIESHPTVGACVVVPMRVSQTLLRLKAIVMPARKDVTIDPRELRELARRELSAYKVPRVFEVRESLPRSPAGKIMRNLVNA